MKVFEAEMPRMVRYTSFPKDAAEFIEAYDDIQTEFLNVLAEATGFSFAEVQGQYLAWYYGDNLYIPSLPADVQAWVNDILPVVPIIKEIP